MPLIVVTEDAKYPDYGFREVTDPEDWQSPVEVTDEELAEFHAIEAEAGRLQSRLRDLYSQAHQERREREALKGDGDAE